MGLIGAYGVGRALVGATGSDPDEGWMRWAASTDLAALKPGEAVTLSQSGRDWLVSALDDETLAYLATLDPRTLKEGLALHPRLIEVQLGAETGRFAFFEASCSLDGCAVAPDAFRWRCPCCGSLYDPVGRLMEGPAPRALAVPRFRIARGTAFIHPEQADG